MENNSLNRYLHQVYASMRFSPYFHCEWIILCCTFGTHTNAHTHTYGTPFIKRVFKSLELIYIYVYIWVSTVHISAEVAVAASTITATLCIYSILKWICRLLHFIRCYMLLKWRSFAPVCLCLLNGDALLQIPCKIFRIEHLLPFQLFYRM